MRIAIVSKSGDFNTEYRSRHDLLQDAMKELRTRGGYYYLVSQDRVIFLPFEEIKFIEKA